MILRFHSLALGALVLSASTPLALGLNAADIPADMPVSKLISSANVKLATGNTQEALRFFDAAIARDPQNYLTLFKRGAAYLSVGRNRQAEQDFDKVLTIKPGFEGALLQLAKIKSRNAEWGAARKNFEATGRTAESAEITELNEAEVAASAAVTAADKSDWDTCISQAGVAILVAGTSLELRKLRAKCRLEKGEVVEAVSDLQHVLQISSGSTDPHLQISAMTFFSIGETEKGLAQVRKCLQSDPDSRSCMRLLRREKTLAKTINEINQNMEKRRFSAAVKLLTKSGEDNGLLDDIKEDVQTFKDEGYIHKNAPNGLYNTFVELTCQAYRQMNNRKRAQPYCTETLTLNPTSLHALLNKAEGQVDSEDWDAAIRTLNEANEHHQGNRDIHNLMQKAQTSLRRSKQKDYYKVLGVDRDADEKQIKRAYRNLSRQYHPDKALAQGISKEDAEKKMSAINEAYEVLKDPELKARFDNGDDPNSQEGGSPFQGSPFGHGFGGQQFVFRQSGGQGFGGGFPGGEFKFQQGGFPFGGFQFGG